MIQDAMAISRQFGITVCPGEEYRLIALFKKAYTDGMAAEREACAQVSDDIANRWSDNTGVADAITAAIRARSNP